MLMHCFAVNALFLGLLPKPDLGITRGKTTRENQIRFQLSFCSICGRPRICARILQWASYLTLESLPIFSQESTKSNRRHLRLPSTCCFGFSSATRSSTAKFANPERSSSCAYAMCCLCLKDAGAAPLGQSHSLCRVSEK